MTKEYSFRKAAVVTPSGRVRRGSISIEHGRLIGFAGKATSFALGEDYLVFPALINIHDHLRGDYLPRVGPPPDEYYLNWSFWDRDLKSSPAYRERANISLDDSYLLGAYKNLFSGVITVNDHFPHEFNAPFLRKLPVRAFETYTLAHECSSYDLKWGDGVQIEHTRAVRRNHPFITHLEEGFDKEAQAGVELLADSKALDGHAVLVHCIGFSDADIAMVRKAQAHVVWCPASNMFMFNFTCKIRKFLAAGIPVSLGTDSTHTGSVNLLEEMRYARSLYRRLYGEELPAERIFSMVTLNPARACRMQDRVGALREGLWADLLIVRRKHEDAMESLLQTGLDDIELVLREGEPVYGNGNFQDVFDLRKADYSELNLGGRRMLASGAPAELLRRVQASVGYGKQLDFMPLNL
jgi:5-methylthioadenosine/S-adenosylhomocysteine deaminase